MRIQLALFVLGVMSLGASAQAPIPIVAFEESCESRNPLIGELVTLEVTFDNTGTTGFGPFIDLVLDYGGRDAGSAPCDGIELVAAQMVSSNPVSNIPIESLQIAPAPCHSGNAAVVHPYASSGVTLTGMPPGAQLAVLKLLFGSVEASQPKVRVALTIRVHRFADVDAPLRVYARGGFRYGNDALDVPGSGQPVLNPPATVPVTQWPFAQITPSVLGLEKKLLAPENEVVPGENYPAEFEIKIRVAPGQTITDLSFSDTMYPQGAEFLEVLTDRASSIQFGGDQFYFLTYSSLQGPADSIADVITARFITIEVSPFACVAELTNSAVVTNGQWKPEDPRDGIVQVRADIAPTFKKKSIALLKTATPADTRGVIPGNSLDYRIDFRISDHVAFRDLVIDDEMTDGLRFVPGSARFTARDATGAVLDAPFPQTLITSTAPVTGTYLCIPRPEHPCELPVQPQPSAIGGSTHLRFLFSQAMMQIPGTPFPTGTLTGYELTPKTQKVPATGTLTFRADIEDELLFGPHASYDEGTLDKHDPLLNRAEIRGTVVGSANTTCGDDSTSCLAVEDAPLQKHIVAKNKILFTPVPHPVAAPPRFTRDDLVTYRLTKTIPSGDAEQFTIRDWFPQPVLTVANIQPISPCGALPPDEDRICHVIPAGVPVPALTVDQATNSITLDFGNLNDSKNARTTIEIYITLKVKRDPFADGLFLTNEAQECEFNSYGLEVCQSAIAQMEITEPLMRIRKGILCASPSCSSWSGKKRSVRGASPDSTCSGCPRVTNATSANIGSLLMSSATVDAGDTVTHMIVLENLGRGEKGAFDVIFEDTLAPSSPAKIVESSICVRYGDGTPIGAILTTSPTSITGKLADPIEASTSTNGRNLVIVTYDVQLNDAAHTPINSCVRNMATLKAYSNIAGGQNFIDAGFVGQTSATTAACVKTCSLEKSVISTSEAHTREQEPYPLAIGEIVRYRLRFHLPEGTAEIVVQDVLPPGLEIIETPIVRPVNAKTFVTPFFAWDAGGEINLFKVTNADDDSDSEYFEIELTVRVQNVLWNNDGDSRPNYFTVTADGSLIGKSNTIQARVVEPKIVVEKKLELGPEARSLHYTVTIANDGSTAAFDVTMIDLINSGLWSCFPEEFQRIEGMAVETDGIVENLQYSLGPGPMPRAPQATIGRMQHGSRVTFRYSARELTAPTCSLNCDDLTNAVRVTGTSLPLDGTDPLSAGEERTGSGAPLWNDYAAGDDASVCARICGMKFNDVNENGIRDAGELPVANWLITADAPAELKEVRTNTDGTYCIALRSVLETPTAPGGPANILLREEQRTGWKIVAPPKGIYIPFIDVGVTHTLDFANHQIQVCNPECNE